jgi:integral membrane protein (TIGR01906 family)
MGIWARRGEWWRLYRTAVSRGGWLTVGIIAAILLAIMINFNTFFVYFHRVFFEGDTWMFRYTDSLIRLFPMRFWQDAFIIVGGLAAISGSALGYFLSPLRKSRKKENRQS